MSQERILSGKRKNLLLLSFLFSLPLTWGQGHSDDHRSLLSRIDATETFSRVGRCRVRRRRSPFVCIGTHIDVVPAIGGPTSTVTDRVVKGEVNEDPAGTEGPTRTH